jgi:hypothetical protein
MVQFVYHHTIGDVVATRFRKSRPFPWLKQKLVLQVGENVDVSLPFRNSSGGTEVINSYLLWRDATPNDENKVKLLPRKKTKK